MLKDLRNIINGAIYGATLIVPGFSATIFAIMLGFYDEVIGAMNHFREDKRKNIRYLGLFVLGIAIGAVLFSFAILFFLERYQFQTMMLFMGLLAGVVPLIASKANINPFQQQKLTTASPNTTKDPVPKQKLPIREILLTVLFLSALIALSRLASVSDSGSVQAGDTINILLILYILLAGIINGATLVIPGLSGALLLLIMGIYPLVIGSLSSVGILIGNRGDLSLLIETGFVLLPFGIGGVIGLLCMAKLMEKLLRDFREAVYASILGLVLGSLVIIFIDFALAESGLSAVSITLGIILFITGCITAYILGKRCDH